MKDISRDKLLHFAQLLFRPVVWFCMKHSLKVQDIVECVKVMVVSYAEQYLEAHGERISDSKISVMTGLHRRDVKRLTENRVKFDTTGGMLSKILGQWQTDKRFLTKSGEPRTLSYRDDESEFYALVESITQDIYPSTVLLELERARAVERTSKGIKIVKASYAPIKDATRGIDICATDIENILSCVEENLFLIEDAEIPHLHIHTEYDNIRPAALPEIRKWILIQGHRFHKEIRDYLSEFDQDINPDPLNTQKGAKVVVGSFSKAPLLREDDESNE